MTFGLSAIAWVSFLASSQLERAVGPDKTWPMLGPFLIVVGWAVFQNSTIAPRAWHHPMWQELSLATGVAYEGRISLDPINAAASIVRLVTYAMVLWFFIQFGRDPDKAKSSIEVVSIAGGVYAIYGLLEYFSGTHTILWYSKVSYLDDLTSTFVNRNNYATYAGLGLLATLALGYQSLLLNMTFYGGRREGIIQAVRFLERRGWPYLIAIFTFVATLLATHSRAGFASTIIGAVVFCMSLACAKGANRKVAVRSVAGFLILVVILYFAGGRSIDQRLGSTDLSQEERPEVYALTVGAIADQPYLGTGLASFEEVFRFYRSHAVKATFDYAHDTYLETALELGLPACLLLIFPFAYMVWHNIRGLRRRRRDHVYPALGLAASTLVGVHSLLDFSAQIPAVAVTYCLIVGVCFAQSWSSRETPVGA